MTPHADPSATSAAASPGDTLGCLDHGDTVIFRAGCEAPGRARIGFGECRGTVLPALPADAALQSAPP